MWTCRFIKPHLTAYLHGELSRRGRRRVAQHLEACESCYAAYTQARDLERELTRALPLVGTPTAPQLSMMWASIQRQVDAVPVHRSHARYGLAVVVFVLALLLPWTLGNQNIALDAPTQPAPYLLAATASPDLTEPAETPNTYETRDNLTPTLLPIQETKPESPAS